MLHAAFSGTWMGRWAKKGPRVMRSNLVMIARVEGPCVSVANAQPGREVLVPDAG